MKSRSFHRWVPAIAAGPMRRRTCRKCGLIEIELRRPFGHYWIRTGARYFLRSADDASRSPGPCPGRPDAASPQAPLFSEADPCTAGAL